MEGPPGSGKSTLGEALSMRMGADHYLDHEPPAGADDSVRDRMVRWFEAGRPRHLDRVAAHKIGGWAIEHLDATTTAGVVLRQALDRLDALD